MKCGCYPYDNGEIEYCPKHKAALDMYEALAIALPFINNDEVKGIIREALAKADKK